MNKNKNCGKKKPISLDRKFRNEKIVREIAGIVQF